MLRTLFLAGLAGVALTAEPFTEPSPVYRLTINGVEHQLAIDQDLTLPGTLTDPTISLHQPASLTLRYGPVSFDYPASYTWESETDTGYAGCTISGNTSYVMLYMMDDEIETRAMLDLLRSDMSGQALTETSLACTAQTFTGYRFTTDAFGFPMWLEGYRLPTPSGSLFVVFQYKLDDDGSHPAEATAMKQQFAATLALSAP